MSRTVFCTKLQQNAEGLERPPLPGELGQKLYNNVSKQAWRNWIAHQTRLINENRLSLADPAARKFLSEELERYFFGDGSLTATGYVTPEH